MSLEGGGARQTPPRVSVVLATYRRQAVLPRAIQSVIDQTLPDWELLVVDDEPNDETRQLVTAFDDPRVRYLRHDQNRGVSAARNTGIENAKAEYVAFLDDDDTYVASKLEHQLVAFSASSDRMGVVTCYERIWKGDGTEVVRPVLLEGHVLAKLLDDDVVRMQTLLVRRLCFEKVGGFDERLRVHEDFDMSLRLARSFDFTTVPEPLVEIVGSGDSLSTNVGERVAALEILLRDHPEIRDDRRVRARWERRMARHHQELGDNDQWRRLLLRSLRSNPQDARTWTVLVVGSLLGPQQHQTLGRARSRIAKLRRRRAARKGA